MSDGNPFKQAVADIGEAVAKPVVNEVGKDIEQGIQTIVSGPQPQKTQDPQVLQQKRAEEEKKQNWARRVIDWYKKIDQDQEKIRQANKQQEMAKNQQEQQASEVKQIQIIENQKKDNLAIENAKTKTETRKGIGG